MMDSPISIHSSSTDTADLEEILPSPPEDYEILGQEDDWALDSGEETPGESSTDRFSKKRRVRGSNGTALDASLIGPVVSLGPNLSQELRGANPVTPAVDHNDVLLTQILEVFPDICHVYANGLITRHKHILRTANFQLDSVELALFREAVYEEILAQNDYPKQQKIKRKRGEHGEDGSNWEDDTLHQTNAPEYFGFSNVVLSKEFSLIPVQHVQKVLREKKRLYHAYLALFCEDNLVEQSKRSFTRLKHNRKALTSPHVPPYSVVITRELNAAKKEAGKLHAASRKRKEQEEAEKLNEEECTRTGNLIECQCCYIDVPANRCVPCEGTILHFFCFACVRKSAETQIGLMKYALQCFDTSGCQATFARSQLSEILGSSIIEKLDSLQQEDEIRKAGLEGLEDCPFCSFKAICPPVEEDREFRCENPSCEIVSCRLCKERSHIPRTCEQAKKDYGLSERHEVEEAMSKALIRNCPKCQVKIVKEDGCNKMQCPNCSTFMCYLCQRDITVEQYAHFGRACSQMDGRDREQREIRQAERATIDKILAERPDITEEQLRVELPESKNTRFRQTRHRAPGPFPPPVIDHRPPPVQGYVGMNPRANGYMQPPQFVHNYLPPAQPYELGVAAFLQAQRRQHEMLRNVQGAVHVSNGAAQPARQEMQPTRPLHRGFDPTEWPMPMIDYRHRNPNAFESLGPPEFQNLLVRNSQFYYNHIGNRRPHDDLDLDEIL